MSGPVPSRRSTGRLEPPQGVTVVVDDQTEIDDLDPTRWASLLERALLHQRLVGDVEVALLFVDEPDMARLNHEFMGQDGATDVLSFPLDEAPPVGSRRGREAAGSGPGRPAPALGDPTVPTLLGDIVICPEVARRNAPHHTGTFEDELALLVVHGLLHLHGLDHADADEARAMRERERELLDLFHEAHGGPTRGE